MGSDFSLYIIAIIALVIGVVVVKKITGCLIKSVLLLGIIGCCFICISWFISIDKHLKYIIMYAYLILNITLKETYKKENVKQKIVNYDINCRQWKHKNNLGGC